MKTDLKRIFWIISDLFAKVPEERVTDLPEEITDPPATASAEEPTDLTDPTQPPEPTCPMAVRKAIRDGVAEIKRFADDHRLTATVVKALLALLARLALASLQGRVNPQFLDVMMRVLQYEQERWLSEKEMDPAADDGLPDINGSVYSQQENLFDLAAKARY